MNNIQIKIKIIVIVFSLMPLFMVGQQKYKLATEYYNAGEYEKSAQLFEALYQENPNNKTYFNNFINCLLDLKDYDRAETIVEGSIKKTPNESTLYVLKGNILERKGLIKESSEEYRKAINNLSNDASSISNLASTFTNLAKYDLAIETYLKAEKIAKVPNLYVYNLADLYRRQGDIKNMIKYYLLTLENEKSCINVQTSLQRFLGEEDYVELQKQLYTLLQEKPEVPYYGEMIQWTFVQKQEYDKALRQAKALDRQFEENGSRVFALAETAFKENDFNTAIDAFEYIVANKGKNTSYYLEAKRGLLNAKKAKVTENFNYTDIDLKSLKAEYISFLEEMGRNTQTALFMQEFADFEALYLNELDTAIMILEEVKSFGSLHPEQSATVKITLGDYYLMMGDRWEATLLYSQVDKNFKEGVLGETARYKNAKLSYYVGDFEWAQEQFKILKGATSKLISNDAIDMSVFITDNLGLDTTESTLQMFATADLLSFQNKYDDAIRKLDSIKIIFPDHSLDDDVLYTKAHIYVKLRQLDKAIEMYNLIIEKYPKDIRADDSIYELAKLYDTTLNDTPKAMELYQKIFVDYSGSTYTVEARQRYRELRGDNL